MMQDEQPVDPWSTAGQLKRWGEVWHGRTDARAARMPSGSVHGPWLPPLPAPAPPKIARCRRCGSPCAESDEDFCRPHQRQVATRYVEAFRTFSALIERPSWRLWHVAGAWSRCFDGPAPLRWLMRVSDADLAAIPEVGPATIRQIAGIRRRIEEAGWYEHATMVAMGG